MPLTPEQREQLRLSLLRFLDANPTRFGVGEGLLLQMAKDEGRPWLEKAHVSAEMDYLHDKELATQVFKVVSPENRSWRIHGNGRDFLAERNS